MARVELTYQEASKAVEDIRKYTLAVRNAADELQESAQRAKQNGIRVEWCDILLQRLETYRENDIEAGLDEMMTQANKITDVKDTVKKYETEDA